MEWTLEEGSRKPRIIANGTTVEMEAGSAFDKSVKRAAAAAGFSGRFYVRMSRSGGPSQSVLPERAPAVLEEGMVIELTPYSVGA